MPLKTADIHAAFVKGDLDYLAVVDALVARDMPTAEAEDLAEMWEADAVESDFAPFQSVAP